MRIRVVGASGGEAAGQRLTCLVINDRVALDAGSLTQGLTLEEQVALKALVLSHSHVDHTNSLPFFIENVYERTEGSVRIYASPETIYVLRTYLFNNQVWPDFSRMPNHLLPSVQFEELVGGKAQEICGIRFTPIPVHHVVPTFGFLIEHGGAAVLWSSDTGPTDLFWEYANRAENLKAVCIDTSFDDSMQRVADVSLHLTPRTLAQELGKLQRKVPVLLHHLKPPCADQIRREVAALGLPEVDFLEQDRVYDFS